MWPVLYGSGHDRRRCGPQRAVDTEVVVGCLVVKAQ